MSGATGDLANQVRSRVTRRVALAVALVVGGCGVGPPIATASDASRAHLQLADLEHGRTLMLAKCGSCHQAPMPAGHPADEWPRELDQMAGRAHLDATERRLIEQYLVTMATR